MYTKAETNNLNYLIGQHLIKSIDYLFCQLKMKMIEHVLIDGKSFLIYQ